ncbi:MAG TPA: hypothetical protein PLL02_04160 [Bacteroidales bacterium]|jgi:hypothetical protein|nr:hypothetical protein [Bacteroidales bacterium]
MRTIAQNRKLYWLFSRLNLNEDAIDALVLETTHGRTSHTSELSFIEAMELIRYLDNIRRSGVQKQRESLTLDRKRKGLIKAIFRWYELQGKQVDMEYVKATACRAAGVDFFNQISEAALTRLYHEFCRKQVAQGEIQRNYYKWSDN